MEPSRQTEWSPPALGIVGVALVGGLLTAGSVTLVTDTPGRLLTGVAGVGLLMFALVSWRVHPKLAITAQGLVVRSVLGSTTLQHADIKVIRITEFRRIGRKVQLLEIDTTDDRLRVFTRWDLGTNPLEVLDALTAAGYAG